MNNKIIRQKILISIIIILIIYFCYKIIRKINKIKENFIINNQVKESFENKVENSKNELYEYFDKTYFYDINGLAHINNILDGIVNNQIENINDSDDIFTEFLIGENDDIKNEMFEHLAVLLKNNTSLKNS